LDFDFVSILKVISLKRPNAVPIILHGKIFAFVVRTVFLLPPDFQVITERQIQTCCICFCKKQQQQQQQKLGKSHFRRLFLCQRFNEIFGIESGRGEL